MAVGDFYRTVPDLIDIPKGDYRIAFEDKVEVAPSTAELTIVYDNGWFRLQRIINTAKLVVFRIQGAEADVFMNYRFSSGSGTTTTATTLPTGTSFTSILNTSDLSTLDAYLTNSDGSKNARITAIGRKLNSSNDSAFSVTIFGDETDIANTI